MDRYQFGKKRDENPSSTPHPHSSSTLSPSSSSLLQTSFGNGTSTGGPIRTMSSLRAHRSKLYARPSCLDTSSNNSLSTFRYDSSSLNNPLSRRKPIVLSSRKVKDVELDGEPQLTSTAQRIIRALQKVSAPVVNKGGIPMDSSFIHLDKLKRKQPSEDEQPKSSNGPPIIATPPFLAVQNNLAPPIKLPKMNSSFEENAIQATNNNNNITSPQQKNDRKEAVKAPEAEDSDEVESESEFEFRDAWPFEQIAQGIRQTEDLHPQETDHGKEENEEINDEGLQEDTNDGPSEKKRGLFCFSSSNAVTDQKVSELKSATQVEPLSGSRFRPVESWACPSCSIYNKNSELKCAACEEPKPDHPKQGSILKEKPTDPLSASMFRPDDSWKCSVCSIYNKNSELKCAACEEPKPDHTKQGSILKEKPADPLSASMFRPDDSWKCSVCSIYNKNSESKCAACEEPKPRETKQGSTKDKSMEPLSASMFRPDDSWKCSICSIYNKNSELKCVACEEPKPGQTKQGSILKDKPLFGFGQPPSGSTLSQPTTTTASPPLFGNGTPTQQSVFGGQPQQSSGVFTFGSGGGGSQPATTVQQFQFGQQPSGNSAFRFGNPVEPTTSASLFGASSVAATQSPFGTPRSAAPPAPQSSFGATPKVEPPAPQSSFGATPKVEPPAPSSFGATPKVEPPAPSSFGATPKVEPPAPQSSFGATPKIELPAPQSPFGAPRAAAPPAPQSSFGATPKVEPPTPQPSFGATPAAPAPQLSFGAIPIASPQSSFGAPPIASPPAPQSSFGATPAVAQQPLFGSSSAPAQQSLFAASASPVPQLSFGGQQQQPSKVFTFGSGGGSQPGTTVQQFQFGQQPTGNSAFRFGNPVEPTTSAPLFGASSAAAAQSPFGATPAVTPQPLFGSSPAPAPQSLFGASASPVPQLSFGAQQQPPALFNLGSGGNGQQQPGNGRPIRKAVRRMQR